MEVSNNENACNNKNSKCTNFHVYSSFPTDIFQFYGILHLAT